MKVCVITHTPSGETLSVFLKELELQQAASFSRDSRAAKNLLRDLEGVRAGSQG